MSQTRKESNLRIPCGLEEEEMTTKYNTPYSLFHILPFQLPMVNHVQLPMINSRNKQFVSFHLCTILSNIMEVHMIPLSRVQTLIHCFQVTYQSPRLSDPLQRYCSTYVLLNNNPQNKLCWQLYMPQNSHKVLSSQLIRREKIAS